MTDNRFFSANLGMLCFLKFRGTKNIIVIYSHKLSCIDGSESIQNS